MTNLDPHFGPRRPRPAVAAVAAALAAASLAPAAHAADEPSLEDLMRTDVVSASRKTQALQNIPAAVFVIGREDIERSGAKRLPEMLRLVPGLHVAQLGADRWAISARGFNGRFANKLLVMKDGRSIYIGLFSGVLWELQDEVLEDLDRIEVILGPGAAMWGSNAVNGVINIITRSARESQGTTASAWVGGVGQRGVALRHGLAAGSGHVRLHAKLTAQGSLPQPDGAPGDNASRNAIVGLRGDWPLADGMNVTLEAAVNRQRAGDTVSFVDPTQPDGFARISGGQDGEEHWLLARATKVAGDGSETTLQGSFDRWSYRMPKVINMSASTLDLDAQHRPSGLGRHDLLVGASLRVIQDDSEPMRLTIAPPSRRVTLGSMFVNDDIALLPEKLHAVVGARVEKHSMSGWSLQPHLRLAWTPTRSTTAWGSIARALRQPSRIEIDANAPFAVLPPGPDNPLSTVVSLAPNGRVAPEKVRSIEFGLRHAFAPNLSLDAAAYVSRYDDLIGFVAGQPSVVPGPPPFLAVPIAWTNAERLTMRGVEAALDWRPDRATQIQAGLNLASLSMAGDAGGDLLEEVSRRRFEGTFPKVQAQLGVSRAFGSDHRISARLRHVGAMTQGFMPAVNVPAYTELALNWRMRVTPSLTMTLSGDNLLAARHAEAQPDLLMSTPAAAARSVSLQLSWQPR